MGNSSEQEKRANKIFYVCVVIVILIVVGILCYNQFVLNKEVTGDETSQYVIDNMPSGSEVLELVSISERQEENEGFVTHRYYNIYNFKGDDKDVGYYFAVFVDDNNEAQSIQAGVLTNKEIEESKKQTAKEIMKIIMKKYGADSETIADLDKLVAEENAVPETTSIGVTYTGYALNKVDEMTAVSEDMNKFYYDYYIKDQEIR